MISDVVRPETLGSRPRTSNFCPSQGHTSRGQDQGHVNQGHKKQQNKDVFAYDREQDEIVKCCASFSQGCKSMLSIWRGMI